MDKSFHHQLGIMGEEKVHEWLRAHKYRIHETNYSCTCGEIDVIATDKKALCFIEIKTRSSFACGFPSEAVGVRKRKKIIAAARYFLDATKRKYREHRFDVIEVLYDKVSESFQEINHIKDAFDVG